MAGKEWQRLTEHRQILPTNSLPNDLLGSAFVNMQSNLQGKQCPFLPQHFCEAANLGFFILSLVSGSSTQCLNDMTISYSLRAVLPDSTDVPLFSQSLKLFLRSQGQVARENAKCYNLES